MTEFDLERQDDLLRQAAESLPGGVLGRHRLPDDRALVFSHGRGAHLFDAAGREFIDFTCGGGALLLGYDHEGIRAAVKEQIDQASHFLSVTNVPAVHYAAELKEVIPCADLVRYTSSGAEATFMSLRLARAFTGREKIVKFEGAYHGHHDYSMWSYSPADPPPYPEPVADTNGIPRCIAETVLVAPYNDLATTERVLRDAGDTVAAVIAEPGQRLMGPRPGFLEGLRVLADELGIVLIFDETVTGFRYALGGAQERFGGDPGPRGLWQEPRGRAPPRRGGGPARHHVALRSAAGGRAGCGLLQRHRVRQPGRVRGGPGDARRPPPPGDVRALLRPGRAPQGRASRDRPAARRPGPGDRRGADVGTSSSPRSRSTTTAPRSRPTGRGSFASTTGSSTRGSSSARGAGTTSRWPTPTATSTRPSMRSTGSSPG